MNRMAYRGTIAAALALFCLAVAAAPAGALGLPYQFNPTASLRGDCLTASPDTVPDPDCPYPAPPEGPSGRFADPRSIAVDQYGNEYVASYASTGTAGRIDVFDDEGHFITEMADPKGPKSVAVDSEGNMYTFEHLSGGEGEVALYEPSIYKPLEGEIKYEKPRKVITTESSNLGGVAVDASNDHLFVSFAKAFIKEYNSAKNGSGLINTISEPKLNWTNWVTIDAERRRLYASFCKDEFEECGVLVLDADAPYELIEELDGSNLPAGEFKSLKGWIGLAVNEDNGHLFAADLEQTKNVYEFDEDFEYFATTTLSSFQGGNSLQIAVSNPNLNPTAKNSGYLFVPVPVNSGNAFAFEPPGEQAPEVEEVKPTNISETEAELHATINPNGGETEYVIEYVTQQEFDETEWANAQVATAGTIPKGGPVTEVIASVDGLSPGTAYRFRVSAVNGVGDDEKVGTFSTYEDASPIGPGTCSNESLRMGFSALLPDCRAYELVTPPDTNGRPTKGVGFVGDRFTTLQASPLGDAVSFVTEGGSLPGTEGTGGFNGDRYRASRSASGWSSVRTGPTGTETTILEPGTPSPDQGYGFWAAKGEGSAVLNGMHTHYVQYPDGRSELIGRGSLTDDPSAIGRMITEGGDHIIFQTQNVSGAPAQQLEPEAPPVVEKVEGEKVIFEGTAAVYDRTSDEVTHVVSLLPGNVSPEPGKNANYLDASADGSGIAFSIGTTVYLRVDNAVTYEIGDITLADVSEGGERAFYLKGGDLFALDVSSEEESVIPFTETGDVTVVNIAPDGSRAYFVSEEAIAGAEENPNGDSPQPGGQNLYLSEEGAISFVGTVTDRDVEGAVNAASVKVDGLGLWTQVQADQPAKDPSRVDGDGSVLLFQSRANLDGYDTGGKFPQIYRYDSVANRLHCISCIPTGTAATGGASLETFAAVQTTRPPFSAYGFVPNLREDGKRAFFESTEALVAADTDDVQDVYEWEEQGVGSCAKPGGCVYLISSGHSARTNYLFGVSRTGDDVFFVTEDILVGGDEDTASVYDARVGGGFPEAPDEECEGEGCRPTLTPPPALASPAKPAVGANDQATPRKTRTCPKGKRKVKRHGKVRCVKKHVKKKRTKSAARKGAGR